MLVNFDFVQYALKHYSVPVFSEDDFLKDLNKIIVIKKMFKRYATTFSINERLVLNNIIILINVFGVYPANVLLFGRINREHWSILKAFLLYINAYVETNQTRLVEPDNTIQTILVENVR